MKDFTHQEIEAVHKRVGHITVPYKHVILVWGGFEGEKGDALAIVDNFCPSDNIWIYNTLTEVWALARCEGDIPERNSGGSAVVYNDYMYLFGGMAELTEVVSTYSNSIYRLNLLSMKWEKLQPSGHLPEPCDKGVGWAYDKKLYFFGGYGHRPHSVSIDFSFHLDLNNYSEGLRGWNNQFSCYDPATNSWSTPKVKGIPPKPRAAHAADIDGHRAFIFGGREDDTRNNHLHCIDMQTLTWSHNLNEGKSEDDIPGGRSWHTFTFVAPGKAVLYGGLMQFGVPSMDRWECEINDRLEVVWKKQPQLVEPLVWHKAAYAKYTGELIIVGGVIDSPYEMDDKDHVKQLLILAYQPLSLFRICLNAVLKFKTIDFPTVDLPKALLDLILTRSYQSN